MKNVNEEFTLEQPKFLGSFPTQTTIIPCEKVDLDMKPIVCYIGVEIYPRPSLPFPETTDELGWDNYFSYLEPITTEEGLEEGMDVVFMGILGELVLAKICKNFDGFYAKSNSSHYYLKFNQDERHCWVAYAGVNVRNVNEK